MNMDLGRKERIQEHMLDVAEQQVLRGLRDNGKRKGLIRRIINDVLKDAAEGTLPLLCIEAPGYEDQAPAMEVMVILAYPSGAVYAWGVVIEKPPTEEAILRAALLAAGVLKEPMSRDDSDLFEMLIRRWPDSL